MKKLIYFGLFNFFLTLSAISEHLSDKVKFDENGLLTDKDGMMLYIYTKDEPNKSNCYDKCADEWKPFIVEEKEDHTDTLDTRTLDVIVRDDEKKSLQVTFDGKPLYYYKEDKKAGDMIGQAKDNEWYVIEKISKTVNNNDAATADITKIDVVKAPDIKEITKTVTTVTDDDDDKTKTDVTVTKDDDDKTTDITVTKKDDDNDDDKTIKLKTDEDAGKVGIEVK